MDTAVVRGVVREAYNYFWQLLERHDDFCELVPKENRIKFVLDENAQPDMRANAKKPAVYVMPIELKANYTLSSDHIEVAMQVGVFAHVAKLPVEDLLRLYEIVLIAVDRWREDDEYRPDCLRRIEAVGGEVQDARGWPKGWNLLARFGLRLVLTRSKE